MRELCRLQGELEVAYARIVVVSVDPPEVQAAFRAGLGARFVFLSDSDRRWLPQLGLEETTDTLHHPYQPACFTLHPDLTIQATYNGYWYLGRAAGLARGRGVRPFARIVFDGQMPRLLGLDLALAAHLTRPRVHGRQRVCALVRVRPDYDHLSSHAEGPRAAAGDRRVSSQTGQTTQH